MTDEAAQIAAWQRQAGAREYPSQPADADQQALLDACALAERLLQEIDERAARTKDELITQWRAGIAKNQFGSLLTPEELAIIEQERDAARVELVNAAELHLADEQSFRNAEARVKALEAALRDVNELIEGYVDVRDGSFGPAPNDAMRAQTVIERVLDGGGER